MVEREVRTAEGKMRRDRKLREEPLKNCFPHGAVRGVVGPAWECRTYAKRDYRGMLRNAPARWSAIDACMNMQVEGVTVRRRDHCTPAEGSPHIHGYWMVGWDQTD